jgi:hypothetical protein
MLLVALGLGALLWSCESEEVGYDVAIPLIGPTEFQETSCEISGDICSTDDDCVDEDGLFVGPCTKTLKRLEPITVQVSLSPGSPSFTLPVPDTASWIAPLNVRTYSDELPISIQMDNFSLEGGPVDISVRVFSRIGRITGRNLDYVPVTPASCLFTLADGATGDDFANGIQTCLSDWIGENGAPLEFDIEVTSSEGAAAKSGFGLKQAGYDLSGFKTLSTVKQCEVKDPVDALEAINEGSDFFELLECEGLSFTGDGFTDDPIEISGGAVVYDRCGNALAQGDLLKEELPIGPYEVRVSETDDGVEVETGVLDVVFTPDAEAFIEALGFAAAGDCKEGAPVGDEGYAIAWWEHCRVTEPPPEEEERTGYIQWGASGFCPVADDSGGGGGSGQ